MERLLKWVFNAVTLFSLLLCVAATALWVRSDQASSQHRGPDAFDLTHKEPLYWLVSNPGRLTCCRQEGQLAFSSNHLLGSVELFGDCQRQSNVLISA